MGPGIDITLCSCLFGIQLSHELYLNGWRVKHESLSLYAEWLSKG